MTAAVGLDGARPDAPRPTIRPMVVLSAISVASVALGMQLTVVVSLLAELEREYDTDLSTITWVYTASLLAGGISGPLLSRFGDMLGRKRMLVAVLVLGTSGAVMCATAQSLGVLITGRVLAGLGFAVIPLGIGIIRDVLPPHRAATGIGVISATIGVGSGGGIILAGVVAEAGGDFRTVFWVCAAIAALGLLLGIFLVFDPSAPPGGVPDVLGATVFTASMVALLLPISQGNNWGWDSDRVRYLLVASAVLLLITLLIERYARDPLIDLKLMADPRTVAASTTGLLLGFALFAAFTLTSNLAQLPESTGYGFGASVMDVGLYLTPNTGGLLVFGMLAGPVIGRLGATLTTALGCGLIGAGYLWLYLDHSSVADLLAAMTLAGIGGGLGYAGLGTMTIQHVDPRQTASASGMNGLFRLIGATIATAIIGSVLSSQRDAVTGAPTDHSFEICFAGCGICAALASLTALVVGLRRRSRAQVAADKAARPGQVAAAAAAAAQPESDPDGVPARALVTVDADDFLPEPRIARHDEVVPVLGGVVRTETGTRVPDVVVTLVDGYGCEAGRTRADEAGRFVLDLPPAGPYLIVLASAGWYPIAERLLLPAHSVHFELVLQRIAVPVSVAY